MPVGRFSPVNVHRLLTGGGINYFGLRIVWYVQIVVSLQVVFSNNYQVEPGEQKDTDLWWALKGSRNKFIIIICFTLKTFPLGAVRNGTI